MSDDLTALRTRLRHTAPNTLAAIPDEVAWRLVERLEAAERLCAAVEQDRGLMSGRDFPRLVREWREAKDAR